MAARLKKPRVKHEPRSAHGRAVKKSIIFINLQYILYTNKHHKLGHSKCGGEKFGSGHRQNDGKKKPRVKHEPRSAHGRAVKKKKNHG